jgi:hypothetical protein
VQGLYSYWQHQGCRLKDYAGIIKAQNCVYGLLNRNKSIGADVYHHGRYMASLEVTIAGTLPDRLLRQFVKEKKRGENNVIFASPYVTV